MKKIMSLVLSLVLLLGLSIPAFAAIKEPDVVPMYNYISSLYVGIDINDSTGIATCDASGSALSGETMSVTLRLQKYDSGWTTVKTWTASGYKCVDLLGRWAVPKGYTYRALANFRVYDANGTFVESGTLSDSEYY